MWCRTLSEVYALHRLDRVARARARTERRRFGDALQLVSRQRDSCGIQVFIDAFAALQTSPRDGITRSAAATRQMAELFHQLQLVLSRELDPLIAPFRNTEPALFNEYRVARKLVHGPTASAEEANKVVPVVTAAGGASPTVETKVA